MRQNFESIVGIPVDVRSIFIGVQRSRLPSTGEILTRLSDQSVIAVPAKSYGVWELMVATVKEVFVRKDGLLVVVDPKHEGSVLKNWPRALLWIPNNGPAGILSYI